MASLEKFLIFKQFKEFKKLDELDFFGRIVRVLLEGVSLNCEFEPP